MKHLFAWSIASCITAFPAYAAIDQKAVKAVWDKPNIALDPAKSYLIVQTSSDASYSFPITLIRLPDQADIDDYRQRRAAALKKAHEKWVTRHATWKTDVANWEHLSKEARSGLQRPAEPVEPTDLNLAFPALDQENMVTIGPFNRFARGNGRSTFLHTVLPGRYAFYGAVNLLNGGATGACMCMGSIQFEVKAGQIVYAGVMGISVLKERAKAKAEGKEPIRNEMDLPESLNSMGWEAPAAGAYIDPRLASYPIVPADLHATGRFPNYFGITIDRLTPIPGVLAYDGDKPVDLKAPSTSK